MASVATPRTAPPAAGGAGRSSSGGRRALAWLLLVPSLAVVALVALYPLGKTIFQSFTDQEFLALTPTKWVGLQNYRDLWHDTLFRDSIWETVKFTLITVTFEFALGLIIALVVNSSFKGRGVMRAVMLVPWAIPTVVAAQMWKWMLDDTFGVVNDAGVRAPHPLALARVDLRPEHRARLGLRRRHLEDDAVRRAAAARRPAGDPAETSTRPPKSTARASCSSSGRSRCRCSSRRSSSR